MPEELKGIYFTHISEAGVPRRFHGYLYDPGYLRYAIGGLMPMVWRGDIKKTNGYLVAGVSPAYYLNKKGEVLKSAVTFYTSSDEGIHWTMIGKIPYQVKDENYEINIFDGTDGFLEPTFEILNDGSYLCVMRTGDRSPMYLSYSYDMGLNWSLPKPFTPNGVRPKLLLLKNGVLVLSSGRPGLQLRVSLDGDGRKWTEPIEMFHFFTDDGELDTWGSSGYPSVLEVNESTFFVVYDNFRVQNNEGKSRKSIYIREISIIKK